MNLSIEIGEKLSNVECDTGVTHRSAYGFIYNDGDAFAIYFALLHTERKEPLVGLTLSIGKWWDDDAVSDRAWVFLHIWPTTESLEMGLMEPKLSRHFSYKELGSPLDRQSALTSPLRDQFFAVADFIVEKDSAVNSYLNTGAIDESKWEQQRASQT